MEKFHHFLYASHIILETNQKPLEAIFSKSISQTTPRLQRILIRTFPYHFTVYYIPGITNQLADCLSWLGQKDTIKLPKLYAYQITNQLCARSDSLNQLRIATQEDDELALLKYTITQGWPSTIKEVPHILQPYWTFGEELTVQDGLVLKGTRIVIPTKKHEAVLKLIHEGHIGLNKCKLHTKDTVYWPGLNEQLEKLILNWELCLKYSQSKCKPKPSMSLGQKIPVHPWSKFSNRHIPLSGSTLSTDCRLHKQVSCCSQVTIHDRTAWSKSVQADIFRVWLARHFNFRQWTMLHSGSFYQHDERVWCQSHYKLATLSVIKWVGRNSLSK